MSVWPCCTLAEKLTESNSCSLAKRQEVVGFYTTKLYDGENIDATVVITINKSLDVFLSTVCEVSLRNTAKLSISHEALLFKTERDAEAVEFSTDLVSLIMTRPNDDIITSGHLSSAELAKIF